eukprot:Phypoly_transcript_05976.p1 GENE.Phypoly_transcript_05976~~Phypoly_transcript_05976.p1  ORF type:complete len:424 (-),score=92.26 Phypoly_transcript_05976:576-1847(-)
MLARAATTMKHLAQQASAASSSKLKEIKMPATAQAMRIDTFLSAPEYFHISRTQAQKLIDNGDVFVNGKSVLKKSMHVKPNDSVSVAIAELPPTQLAKPQQAATSKPLPAKKVVPKDDKEDAEGDENEENGESAEADGEGDEADELESGPTNATGPLITPIEVPLNIVHEDDALLVVLKEPGLVVHPGRITEPSLAAGLLHKYGPSGLSWAGGMDRPGIVHRLDKDTTGLMVIAKSDSVHANLKGQFADHSAFYAKLAGNFKINPINPPVLQKKYITIVAGKPKEEHGFISKGISHNRKERHKMQASDTGKEAVTEYRVIKTWKTKETKKWRGNIFSQLEVTIHTGRTHQIRVHMASQGHPIIGDPLYSRRWAQYEVPYLLLAAMSLQFVHPTTNLPISFSSPIPAHISQFMEVLDKMVKVER